MSRLGNFTQQPREVKYYTITYVDFLDATIPEVLNQVTPTIIISPVTTPVLVVTAAVSGDDLVRLLISGGEDGVEYKVEVIVGTDNDQVKEDEVTINVRDD
jgi:hypothetical protein